MPYELRIADAAHEDIDEALDYIARTLSNPIAAARLLERLNECYEQIRAFPFSFEACQDDRLRHQGYRKVVIENFILVYRPVEAERRVYILRFFYGGRAYEKLL